MKYTLHQLEIFSCIAELKSITRASEKLHMTQPAASIQLKNFQNQFDVPLTEVIGRQLYVTEFGQRVKEIADNVLAETEKLQYETNRYKGILSGKLKISSASTGKYLIPFFTAGFLNNHPGIDFNLDVTNKQQVIDSLLKNEIDFAFFSTIPENLAIEQEILLENRLFYVSNSLEKKNSPRLILREKGSATRDAMQLYFNKLNEDLNSLELTSNEAIKHAIISGLGDSIMPLIGLENELKNRELFIVPKKDLPIVSHWRLAWLKGKKLSPVSMAFLEYVKEHKETIINKKFSWYENYK